MRVGINGFGRIGRLAARVMVEKPHINLVAINSSYDAEYLAYQFMYDSVHGTFKGTVDVDGGDLILNGKRVKIHKTRDVKAIPWKDLGAEYICESTGQFLDTPSCTGHLQNGAKKVVITAPAKDKETPSIVLGVNTHAYNHETMHVVSAASCTTHGLAPIAKVIHEEFGIEHGLMSTIHAMTATQKVVDASSKKDWRSGRAASVNIIPSSTGAAKSIGLCIPELKGKLSGMAYRVPVPDVSVVDLVCQLQRDVTYEEVCDVRNHLEVFIL